MHDAAAPAQVGKSIGEVIEACEITVAMVSDPAAAKQVANEVAQYIKKGAPLVCCVPAGRLACVLRPLAARRCQQLAALHAHVSTKMRAVI